MVAKLLILDAAEADIDETHALMGWNVLPLSRRDI